MHVTVYNHTGIKIVIVFWNKASALICVPKCAAHLQDK